MHISLCNNVWQILDTSVFQAIKHFDGSLRGSNHLGRQGRLAFMAWVSGLFSPSGFSPLEPPFPSNLSFAATHSNFCGKALTSFIFQESSYSLPQPFSAGGSFHLFCHTQSSRDLTCQAAFSKNAQFFQVQTVQIADFPTVHLTKSNKRAIITSNNKRTNVPCGPCALRCGGDVKKC